MTVWPKYLEDLDCGMFCPLCLQVPRHFLRLRSKPVYSLNLPTGILFQASEIKKT